MIASAGRTPGVDHQGENRGEPARCVQADQAGRQERDRCEEDEGGASAAEEEMPGAGKDEIDDARDRETPS